MRVLKIGGNQLEEPEFLAAIAEYVATTDERIVIVHGGGRAISDLQSRLGLETRTIDGLRVTDSESMLVAEMALSGLANKRIVRALLAAGVDALGVSGVDRALLRGRKLNHARADLGHVGEIESVRREVILEWLAAGITLVISPVSLGPGGVAYNVNADSAASAIAGALPAGQLDFISDVPGVLRKGELLRRVAPSEVEQLIESGVAAGGMVPKLRAAARAVQAGVAQARIVDVAGVASAEGTWIVA